MTHENNNRHQDFHMTEEELLHDESEDFYVTCEECGHKQVVHDHDENPPLDIDPDQKVALWRQELKQEKEVDSDNDTDSVVSVSLNPIEEIPLIKNPFAVKLPERGPKWRGPKNVMEDRENQFKWEKPFETDDTENETPAQRIRRLEQTIAEKKQDLDALRKQYSKAQMENYKLAEEIRSFKGEHYDDLKADNAKLKDANGRLFKENMMLRGQMKRMTNGKIAQLEEKRVLEEKYGVKARKSKPASSRPK